MTHDAESKSSGERPFERSYFVGSPDAVWDVAAAEDGRIVIPRSGTWLLSNTVNAVGVLEWWKNGERIDVGPGEVRQVLVKAKEGDYLEPKPWGKVSASWLGES